MTEYCVHKEIAKEGTVIFCVEYKYYGKLFDFFCDVCTATAKKALKVTSFALGFASQMMLIPTGISTEERKYEKVISQMDCKIKKADYNLLLSLFVRAAAS